MALTVLTTTSFDRFAKKTALKEADSSPKCNEFIFQATTVKLIAYFSP